MRAIRLADKMKCPIINTNFKAMVECLRKVEAKKIVLALYEFHVSPVALLLFAFQCKREFILGMGHRSSHSVSTSCRECFSIGRRSIYF